MDFTFVAYKPLDYYRRELIAGEGLVWHRSVTGDRGGTRI